MRLKAVKIDEGHRAITLKKAGPAMIFEKSLHADNLSKCKQKISWHFTQKSQECVKSFYRIENHDFY